MTVRHLGDIVIYLGAVAAALGAIAAVVRWGMLRPLKTWITAEVRGPLEETRTSAAAIEAEVSHNGGSSLKDGVARLETSVGELRSDVRTINARLDDHLINHPRS